MSAGRQPARRRVGEVGAEDERKSGDRRQETGDSIQEIGEEL